MVALFGVRRQAEPCVFDAGKSGLPVGSFRDSSIEEELEVDRSWDAQFLVERPGYGVGGLHDSEHSWQR